jgi:hypothetical protein
VDFIVATSEINRYGFRLDLNGARLEGFQKNPVMLYFHERAGGNRLPIGRWENLRVEGDQMHATAVFDEQDEFAQAVKGKCERGFIHAASVAFDPLTLSEAPEMLKPGQQRPTVTEWELLEISIVDIPGDRNAVRLSAGRDIDEVLPMLSAPNVSPITTKPDTRMEKITSALGLAAGATEDQAVEAITALRSQAIESTLAVGQQKGVVNTTNRAHYEALAKRDLSTVQALFAAAEKPVIVDEEKDDENEKLTFTGLLKALSANNQKPAGESRDNWSFDDWSKKDSDGLLAMKRENPEQYQALAAAKAKAAGV